MENNRKFVIRNIVRALIWLAAFVLAYFLFKKYVDIDYLNWLQPVFDNDTLIYSIFLVSEVIIGIIPPELFMIWAAERNELLINYILVVGALATVSYFAGVLGFLIGRYLSRTVFYRYFRRRFLKKTESRLQVFGPYLVVVAALTPVPFSGVAMLVGSVRYAFKRYFLFSLSRFLRFAIYGWVFWEARAITF
jgi:membrane protein DedA with SNARE-associated domain